MSNHFHAIIDTPDANLGEVMKHLMTNVAKGIQTISGRINHVFGARYNWTTLSDPYSVAYVYKYVYRNPVRARVCALAEDYSFSSLNFRPGVFNPPLVDGIGQLWKGVPENWNERLDWVNLPTRKELEELIGKGLRRADFALTKSNESRRMVEELRLGYAVEKLSPFGQLISDR